MRPTGRTLRAGLLTVAAAVATAALGGCASGPANSSSSQPSSATSATAPTASAHPVVLDERARGTTVRVATGTQVVVRLHSTYWSPPAASDKGVLTPTGGGTTPAATCPPGRGCGTSSEQFTALRPGTAHVTARRDACGEAMRCPPGQGRYDVIVTVIR
jgi:hypothetical protein